MNFNVMESTAKKFRQIAAESRRNLNAQFETIFEEWIGFKSKAGSLRGVLSAPTQSLLRVTTPEELASAEKAKRASKASRSQSSDRPH